MKPHAGTPAPKGAAAHNTAVTIILAIGFLSLVLLLSYVFINATSK